MVTLALKRWRLGISGLIFQSVKKVSLFKEKIHENRREDENVIRVKTIENHLPLDILELA